MKTKLFITKVLLLFAVFAIHLNAQAQLRQSQTNATQSTALQQAKENPAADIHNPENQSPFDAVKGLKEDLSKRDAFSKHYINEDGSFTALIGAGPIHYERNGQFLDIDHTITQSSTMNFPFANTTNLMESYFGATVEYGVKSKTMEGEVVEFMNPTMYWEVNGQATGTQQAANTQAQIQADKATYPNIYGDISAEYKVLTGKREMNYIIPNPQALGAVPAGADYLVFTEDVVLPFGWTSSLTEMGIMIKDAMGQEIYLYENPHSTDAESHALREENTIFETLQIGNTLTIKTKVKTSWLLSNERVFPVKVDPTVSVNTINSNSTGQCWPTGGGYGNPYVGYNGGWYRSWVTFNLSSLPALSKGSVSSVSTSLYVRSKLGTAGTHTVRIGHSKFDLASTTYFPTFSGKYNGMTDPVNAAGAYGEIPMSATLNQYATANLSIDSYEVIETQTGTANAFFPISLSPSWGTGTINRGIGFYGHGISGGTPILTINYSIPDTHCRSTHTSSNCAGYGDCQYIGISNVSIGSINNTTPFNNAPNGYNNYSNISTDISEGTTYNLNVTYRDNAANSGQLAAWIDWNNDGDFNDANEYLGVFNNRTNNQVTTFSVNVPSGTTAGIKRLRIRSVYQGEGLSSTDACTTKQYGETEDYSLNVIVVSGMPNNIVFYNYGGSEQLAFNNSRIDTDTPVFRMSHGAYDASDYEVEINTTPDFTGTAYSQTFTGTYPLNTEANFEFTNGFVPSNNTTYYVRARVKGAAEVWSAWTDKTYSFTYNSTQTLPDWYQSTATQFATDILNGVNTHATGGVITGAGGNRVVNGDFSNGINGWSTSKSYNVAVNSVVGANEGCTGCSPNAKNFRMGYPWAVNSVFTSDNIILSQQIDLTNVNEIKFDVGRFRSFGGIGTATNSAVYFKIGGTLADETGTTLNTFNINSNGSFNDGTITVNTTSYTGLQTIKFVFKTLGTWDSNTTAYFYVSKVIAEAPPAGTVTSTPIHLASVQDATGYEGITWDQTLNGGNLTLKVQGSDNGTNFIDIPGYTNISETGDGVKTLDLSQIQTPPAHIRLVGALDGQNVVLHDWAIEFKKDIPEDCEITTTWNGIDWSHGYPTESPLKKVIFTGDYTPVATDFPGLFACAVDVQGTAQVILPNDFSFIVENEVKVASGAKLTIQNGANLVQINDDAVNEGEITVEKLFTFSSEREQYNFVMSPVEDQDVTEIYDGDYLAQYYRESDNKFVYFDGSAEIEKGKGRAIEEPSNADVPDPTVTAHYQGKPFNGVLEITGLTNGYSGFHLAGNPYPSQLDLDKFYEDNKNNIESRFLFWDNRGNEQITQYGDGYNGDHYAKYNALSQTGVPAQGETVIDSTYIPTKEVAVGNGFMLRLLNPAEAKYVYKNAQRTIGSGQNFLGKGNNFNVSDKDRYWLTLNTPNNVQVMNAVVYFEGGNDEYAMDDNTSAGGSDDFYSMVENRKLAIQGKSSFEISDTIALGYKAFHAGTHSINLYQSEGVFTEGVNILLIDKALEITQNLSEQASYSFTTEAGEFQERFIIVYEEQGTEEPEEPEEPDEPLANVEIEKGGLIVYKHGNQTVISSDQVDLLQLEVFNLQGQKLMNRDKIHAKTYRLDNERLGKQALLLVVTTADGKEHSFKILTQ